ncbi:hypothetical protein L9F63_013187 [Diploptera punctata]|uniref:Uncharacterized protein n=1 Tax=Diploptera punctata TaxID=6984 RepID=A0AAD8ABG9_DIPPU|nr:hypothetical protein L9F63_013187 [Diploptera punctata]
MMWPLVFLDEVSLFEPLLLHSSVCSGYLLFLSSTNEEELLEDLSDKLNYLLDVEAYDSKTKFIVFVTNSSTSLHLAKSIFNVAWKIARIVNIVVVVFCYGTYLNDTELAVTRLHEMSLESYIWFPYHDKDCKDVTNVKLIEKKTLDEISNLTRIDYYPLKIPKDFCGCSMKVTPYGIPPYTIVNNYTDANGNEVYEDNGLSSELLKLFAQVYNITLLFRKSPNKFGIVQTANVFLDAVVGNTDFVVGAVVLLPVVTRYVDCSIPLTYESLKILAPCPTQLERVHKMVTIFTPTAWLSIGLVLVFVCCTLWFASSCKKKCDLMN